MSEDAISLSCRNQLHLFFLQITTNNNHDDFLINKKFLGKYGQFDIYFLKQWFSTIKKGALPKRFSFQ